MRSKARTFSLSLLLGLIVAGAAPAAPVEVGAAVPDTAGLAPDAARPLAEANSLSFCPAGKTCEGAIRTNDLAAIGRPTLAGYYRCQTADCTVNLRDGKRPVGPVRVKVDAARRTIQSEAPVPGGQVVARYTASASASSGSSRSLQLRFQLCASATATPCTRDIGLSYQCTGSPIVCSPAGATLNGQVATFAAARDVLGLTLIQTPGARHGRADGPGTGDDPERRRAV